MFFRNQGPNCFFNRPLSSFHVCVSDYAYYVAVGLSTDSGSEVQFRIARDDHDIMLYI